MKTNVSRVLSGLAFTPALFVILSTARARADERDAGAAMQAAQGHSPDMEEPERPAKMPDLTRGDPLPPPGKDGPVTWNMGPTGIVGIKNGGNKGDQVQVISVIPGSPAEGKVLPGDVLLGVGGTDFTVGGNINVIAGNAIIEAETEEGKGVLNVHLWRDRNWTKREAPKNMFGVDIEKLFREAEESSELYEWKEEEAKTVAVRQMAYDEFPIDGVEMDMELQLQVMGTYSDSSPWDCPVVEKVRENALKIIAKKFRKPDNRGRIRGSWPDVLALVASGDPEYVQLAKEWVHSQKKLCQDMAIEPSIADMPYKGMQSWRHGFEYLEMAIYYDATGDTFVLPELRKRAILVAQGQSGGGSWGHTFSFPSFNGGKLHGRNPGYGGMNNAGTRCFFLLTLAKKHGIEHPEIDAAIERASRFFGTFVDKGCIPYGYHPPWPSDDSNGKNYGAAYAFYVLGDIYKAKYFGLHSAHAAFSRRGGHGSPTLWYYTPLSANLAGPGAIKAHMRNMRYFYTLSRRHDGSFIFLGEQAPGIGGKGMRNPTATVAMFMSYPLHQLVITGKDAKQEFWATEEEYEELMLSARPQIVDPTLLEQIGKRWQERTTDEIIDQLDHFFPKARGAFARELGKRYAAGEKDILGKVVALLGSEEARMRDGACLALSACGRDEVLASLSKVRKLLDDPAEFVRMTAGKVMGRATEPEDADRQLALLEAAADEYTPMSMDNGNVRTAIKGLLLPGKRGKLPLTKLAAEPFETDFDEELVRTAMEKIVTLDPGGIVPSTWTRDTLVKLAGPIVYVADEMQLNDTMFGYGRTAQGRKLLNKYGVREMIECDLVNVIKLNELDRHLRPRVTFAHRRHKEYVRFMNPNMAREFPGPYKEFLPQLYGVLHSRPLEDLYAGEDALPVPLFTMVKIIEDAEGAAKPMPSLTTDVAAMFERKLSSVGSRDEQVRLCRYELKDPARRNYFRQMAAMSKVVELLGPEGALPDLLPYFGHEQWRVRRHVHELGLQMVKSGAEDALIEAAEAAAGENGAGMWAVLVESGAESALDPARRVLKKDDPVVRRAAIKAVMALGGDQTLAEVFAFMERSADPYDMRGCEEALLSRREDPTFAAKVRKESIGRLPQADSGQRASLAWVLGQLGGPESMAALKQAAIDAEGGAEVEAVMMALAYSPDRAADRVMLDLAKRGKELRDAVAAHSVYRMVGPTGPRDLSDDQRLDFATPMLHIKHDARLIAFLGRVHTGRCATTLLDVMKVGSTETAAKAIIACVEGMNKPPQADAKAGADALTEVIEYIEVTRLRGGIKAHMKKEDKYVMWKELQARAGKALLKVHKPTEATIEGFDDMDLDL